MKGPIVEPPRGSSLGDVPPGCRQVHRRMLRRQVKSMLSIGNIVRSFRREDICGKKSKEQKLPTWNPRHEARACSREEKKKDSIRANLNSYMYTGKDSIRLLQAYEVWILSKDITHCKTNNL